MSDFLTSWSDRKKRLIIFAGVFDPVHKGHIAAAEAALSEGSKVLFLPERVPQHKHGATPYNHRLEMLKIATQGRTDMEVVDYPRKHHWVEPTFMWLREVFQMSKFVWLVGSDVAPHIESWPGCDNLHALNVAKIVVVDRGAKQKDTKVDHVHGTSVEYIQLKNDKYVSTSSTEIRADNEKHTGLVPEGVAEYISLNNLYL